MSQITSSPLNSPPSRPAPHESGPADGAVAEFEALYRANVAVVTAYFARRSADPQTVADLTEALGASQQNVSKHLAVLADVGILGRRKEGNRVYYRIADGGVLELGEQVCGSLEQQLHTFAAAVAGVRPSRRTKRRPTLTH